MCVCVRVCVCVCECVWGVLATWDLELTVVCLHRVPCVIRHVPLACDGTMLCGVAWCAA